MNVTRRFYNHVLFHTLVVFSLTRRFDHDKFSFISLPVEKLACQLFYLPRKTVFPYIHRAEIKLVKLKFAKENFLVHVNYRTRL